VVTLKLCLTVIPAFRTTDGPRRAPGGGPRPPAGGRLRGRWSYGTRSTGLTGRPVSVGRYAATGGCCDGGGMPYCDG